MGPNGSKSGSCIVVTFRAIFVGALGVLWFAGGASAQTASPVTAPPPAVTPEVTSGVNFSEIYSDNIYATRTAKTSDWISVLSPYLNLALKNDKGQINIGGDADIGRYAQYWTRITTTPASTRTGDTTFPRC